MKITAARLQRSKPSRGRTRGGVDWLRFDRGKRPLPGLAEAARGLLAANLEMDGDGVLRRVPTLVRIGGRVMPSVAWGLCRDLNGPGDSPAALPLDASGQVRLLYFRTPHPYPAEGAGTTFSLRDVVVSESELLDGRTPELPPQIFSGKIVFVGFTAQGLRDDFNTPIRPEPGRGLKNWPLHAVEVHAEALDLLRQGRLIRAAQDEPVLSTAALLLLAAMVLGAAECTLRLRPAASALALAAGVVAIVTAATAAFRLRMLALPMAAPLAALLIVWGAGTVRALVRSLAARRQVQDLFGRYLAPAVVQRLVENPGEAAPGGTRRTITVLFSDIRDFTSWSESRPPEAVVRQLNEYLSAMSEVVAEHGGYVDKFIGDALMAIWGVPLFQADHADRGLATARAMLLVLEALNADWERRGLSSFRIGIGLHSGEALVGNLGSVRKADYTAIGDTVNTASRLEGMNKVLKTTLLVSKACRDAMVRPAADLRSLGVMAIRSREGTVELFSL